MKYFLLTLLLACCHSYAVAEVYKWVDEQGRTHYGDNPNDTQRKAAVNISSYESVTYSDATDMSQKPTGSSVVKSAKKKKVTMYSTEWCGYCKKAKKYFQAKGIPFVEYDIEKNARAKRAYDALGGKGVPVITMGKKRMNGFSPEGFERFYR
jgi:glutaredoxin-like YruB-family protein